LNTKKPFKWVEQAVVISAMRRAFRRYPAYKQCLQNAKSEYHILSKHGKNLRRVQFECASCRDKYSQKNIAVDHILPVVDPNSGFVDYDTYAKRLFCALDNLQILCKACHKTKSKTEAAIRARARKENK
jgi:5-methylcytosine-specific restriction endonuclease McrA